MHYTSEACLSCGCAGSFRAAAPALSAGCVRRIFEKRSFVTFSRSFVTIVQSMYVVLIILCSLPDFQRIETPNQYISVFMLALTLQRRGKWCFAARGAGMSKATFLPCGLPWSPLCFESRSAHYPEDLAASDFLQFRYAP